ncbi:MAG: hypothetical protein ACYS5V_10390 [Planctomycetota bacterium]
MRKERIEAEAWRDPETDTLKLKLRVTDCTEDGTPIWPKRGFILDVYERHLEPVQEGSYYPRKTPEQVKVP